MLDHIGIPVSDYNKAKSFYENTLAPLGIGLIMEATAEQTSDGSNAAGFGVPGKAFFWISSSAQVGRIHLAFAAATRESVDAFHRAALAAGGRDNGEPGLRPQYHPHYYGAFVLDHDGHNIEAVCRAPPVQ